MNSAAQFAGKWLANYLSKEMEIKGTAPPSNPLHLQASLRPGDVLLVEGNTRLSTAIKYLSQSTWSHAALYVGMNFSSNAPEGHCLVDADTVHGVRSVDLGKFANLHTRICRPIGLSQDERLAVAQAAISKIGYRYDLRNVFDLARYLLPTPPVPTKFRRQLLSLGSGDPTRAICSTLIVEAFKASVTRYCPWSTRTAQYFLEINTQFSQLPSSPNTIHFSRQETLMFPPTSQSSSQLLNAGLISMILNGWSKSLDKSSFEVSFQRLFQY